MVATLLTAHNVSASSSSAVRSSSASGPARNAALAPRMHRASDASFMRGQQLVIHRRVQVLSTACRGLRVEANLFSRVIRVVKSYANQLVSSAEDPEKLLDQAVTDLQGDVIKMRQASAQVLASQKQLEAKYKQAKTTADDWYRRAELALQKGDEELAKEALKRRKAYEDNAKSMKGQLDQQEKAVGQLIANTKTLEAKLAEAKSKKDTLKARAKSAAASKEINDMMQGLSTSTAYSAFERMEEKVMALEAESEATLQLATSTTDDLEGKFARLESGTVDDDLAKLKKGMLNGPARKAELPEGRPIRDAIDWELEELRRKSRE